MKTIIVMSMVVKMTVVMSLVTDGFDRMCGSDDDNDEDAGDGCDENEVLET